MSFVLLIKPETLICFRTLIKTGTSETMLICWGGNDTSSSVPVISLLNHTEQGCFNITVFVYFPASNGWEWDKEVKREVETVDDKVSE